MMKFGKKNEKTSTSAMREAAALLGKLRLYQEAYLLRKKEEVEELVAHAGGATDAMPDASTQSADDASFEDFWG